MDLNPICQPSPANKMKCFFLDYVELLMISRACQWTWTPSTTCLQPKKLNAHILIMFNFWCWTDWSMDSNPIHHPSPANKMKCFFSGLCSLLMISQAGWWTQTPSATPLQQKKWNAHILIMFNFWWLARLVNGLKPHPPLLSSQKIWNAHFWVTFNFWWLVGLFDELKPHLPPLSYEKNEMLNFRLRSTSNDQPGWSMDSNPICHPSPAKKMKCFFYGLHSTSDDWLGWVMDSNPIHQPPPAKKMKCSFLYYIQLMILTRLVNGLEPHPPPLYSQKNEMLLLWITLNFWWLAGLSDGLKPHPSTPSCQKNEMLIFGLHSLLMIGWASWWTWTPSATPLQPIKWNSSFWIVFTSDDQPGWLMGSNPICHPSPAKKWNATFWITFNFLWLARLVNGLKPHPPPLSSQRNEILIFGLYSTSNDQPGLSMDLNPIHHLSPAKK